MAVIHRNADGGVYLTEGQRHALAAVMVARTSNPVDALNWEDLPELCLSEFEYVCTEMDAIRSQIVQDAERRTGVDVCWLYGEVC